MFHKSQWEAVNFERGAAMVLAGPGTGKTTVITHRIKRLIEKGIALPEEILVVTFTKAAAVEMEQRFEKIMDGKEKRGNVCFGTFHSIFLKMLRESGGSATLNSVLSEGKRIGIIKEIIMRISVEVPDMWEFIRDVSAEISRVKGRGEKKDRAKNPVCDEKTFKKILEEYEKALIAEGVIDFDDMILKCSRMLREDSGILDYWKKKYPFILIDEFQDINRMQYENIKMLAGRDGNIFVVGDDDQSIYGFRGSEPEIMFLYEKDFHPVKIINLKVNYRSTEEILKVSENLICHNIKRYRKNIVSAKGAGSQVEIREFKTNMQQYRYMIERIQKYLRQGIAPDEIAILVRNNGSIPVIRNFLMNHKIVTAGKGANPIYENSVARDIISYIRAAMVDMDVPLKENPDLIHVINKPERFISRRVIGACHQNLEQIKEVYAKSPEVLRNINELKMHLQMMKELPPFAAINYIRYGVNYEKYMKEHMGQKERGFEGATEIFDAVLQEASRFTNHREWLEFVGNNRESDSLPDRQAVNIITMHGAKGLEYKVVFLPDVNQEVVPGARAVRDGDISEERRIFYVALTRASEHLHVYFAQNYMNRKCKKSQFINEMCSYLQF